MATRAVSSPIRLIRRRVLLGWGPRLPLLGRVVRLGLGVGVLGTCAVLGFAAWVQAGTAPLIYTPQATNLPEHHVALVFGAGLDGEGGPSAVLYDRVATAAALYHAGKVQKLLMSGDNSQED